MFRILGFVGLQVKADRPRGRASVEYTGMARDGALNMNFSYDSDAEEGEDAVGVFNLRPSIPRIPDGCEKVLATAASRSSFHGAGHDTSYFHLSGKGQRR